MDRRTALKVLVVAPVAAVLPAVTAVAVPPKTPVANPLREILWSPHEPSGLMIAVEVPVDHPPVALCTVLSPDGTKFVGHNVCTSGDAFFYGIDRYYSNGIMRYTANTGLVILTGRTVELQDVVYRTAIDRIAGPGVHLGVMDRTAYDPHRPPVYVFVPAKS